MKTRRLLQRRRGANAVEFALVMPVYLLLVGGAIEYGWFFAQEHVATVAARACARTAAVTPSTVDNIATLANTAATEAVAPYGAVAPAINNTNTTTADAFNGTEIVTCTVTAPYFPLTGLVPAPTGGLHVASVALREAE